MENYFGRLLLKKDFDSSVSNLFIKNPSMRIVSTGKIQCLRCGSIHKSEEVQLPNQAFYCPSCIQLGRVRSDEGLYALPQEIFPQKSYLRWTGKLTAEQQKLADSLVSKTAQASQVLVRAVTGAGKTEITYPMIDQFLKKGACVAFVSPRIDVCLEIHQRLTRDFSCAIPLLYSEGNPYFRSPLIVATSHQLLRFREAFDLLIVDEVDAFPFADNEMLYFAVQNAMKINSNLVFLTATTTERLEKKIRQGELEQLELNQRFHGGSLSIPRFFWQNHFDGAFKKQRLSGFPLLIFAPEIAMGESFAKKLQEDFPSEKIAFVSSLTPQRAELVEQFRKGLFSVLVSTSILERGVTFPKVDVFVIKAEHQNFTKSALIQMSGRVGRSIERPHGLIYFFHAGRTKAMVLAKREIKKSNQRKPK